ncbi:MAG: LysR family transcriptional regulator [Peptococcaceae bacterium]|nr:LysR family transcriptional regulator [Peptococcaceae bacterium]
MKIENLKLFLTVVQTGSINQAADKLFLSHQNLGAIIRNLEKELGVQLFVRNNKGIVLTPTGEKFYAYAKQIVDLYDDFFQQIQPAAVHNVLNFYTTPSVGQLFYNFQDTAFGNRYYLSFYQHSNPELREMLQNKKNGIYFLPIHDGIPSFLEQYPEKYIVAQDHSRVTICHKTNDLLHPGKDIQQELKKRVMMIGTNEMETRNSYLNISDIAVCKKMMREKGFIYSTTQRLYEANFPEDEWYILSTTQDIQVEYLLIFHLEQIPNFKAVKNELIEKIQQCFNA